MSNPLDSSIETLKTAEPRAEAIERAVDALSRPHPARPARLIPLAAGVAALSLIALWPRGSSGVAWAQIAAQTPPPRYVLRVERVVGNQTKLFYETKMDSTTGSYRMSHMTPTGAVEVTKGKDGYFWPLDTEWISGPFGYYFRMRGIARYSHRPPKTKFVHEGWGRQLDLSQLLNQKGMHQVGLDADVQTRVGKADRYRLESEGYQKSEDRIPLEVYVQPGSKRILGWDRHEEKGAVTQTTVTYPDHFTAADWAFPTLKGVPSFDLDKIDDWAKEQVKKPLATLHAGGATSQLRFVVQGYHHEMWFVWSGAKPNGDLKDKVQVLGVKNGLAYGLAEFAAKPGAKSVFRYGGHAVHLDRKLDFVDLKVPVFKSDGDRSVLAGYATARHIPVKQVPEFDAIWPALATPKVMR